MATYRLNQLKIKQKDLLEESVIAKELMDTVLLKIRNSIKNLEYEESRPKFNKKIMTIVLLADKFNQILMHFNLMLEELVISQDYKFEQDLNATNDINFFDEENKDDDGNIRKDERNVEESTNSVMDDVEYCYIKKNKKIDVKKSNSRCEMKLSCNEEFKMSQKPTFVSENFCESFENIPEKILVKSNNDMKICHNPALFASENVSKTEKLVTDNIPEIKQNIVDGTSNKSNEKCKTFPRSNHIDYKPTINSIRKHEVESKETNDQELSYRKVLDYLQKQPERAISPQSKKKISINLGAPELVESKFHTSKKIKELQKSKLYSDIVSFNKLEITDLNKKQLKMPLSQTVEESKEFKNLEIIKKNAGKNERNNIVASKKYSNSNNKQNSIAEISEKFGQDQTYFEIIAKNETSDVVLTEKLIDECKVTVQNGDRCIVTHINSPGCFFIITASESIIDYDRFHEMLQHYCDSDESKKFLSKKKMMSFESNYFCCYNEVEDYNCTWFRCIVTDWLMNNSEKKDVVKVLAVDDGFEKEISLNQLRDYPHTIFNMPRMAIKCRLRDVYPPNSSKNNILVEWPENCIQFFHDLVRDSRKNPFTVTDIKKNVDFYEVNLRNPRGVSVSKAMIHTDHGVLFEKYELLLEKENKLVKSEFMRQQILKAQGWHSNDDLDWENMDDIEENLTQAVANAVEGGYIPKDFRRLCRFTKIDGQPCFKGERCRFDHKLPDPGGWTTDKEIAYTETINKLEMPEINSKIKLLVTSVRSVYRFFAHFKLSPEKRKVLLSQNFVSTAGEFSKSLNKTDELKTLRKLRTLPALGQLVLAKSSADNRWYRARVIMINTEDEFEVLFIDYGDRSTVPFNSLREIRREHLSMPQQAIECRIANIDPLDIFNKEISTKAAEELSHLILDKTLTAEVTDNGYPLEVLLYTENNIDIGEYLIKLNIATERNTRFIMKSKKKQVEC